MLNNFISENYFKSLHSVAIDHFPITSGVYFILGENGLIKIGCSWSIYDRLGSLRSALPFDIKLIGYIECKDYYYIEKILHMEFSKYKIRGEWYKPHEDILDFIFNKATVKYRFKYVRP